MRLHRIEAENFRGLPEFSINFHEQLNIFIGSNGAGKTSMLDLIALLISQCPLLSNDRKSARPTDIRNGAASLSGKLSCKLENSFLLVDYVFERNSMRSRSFENASGNFDNASLENAPLQALHDELDHEEIPFSHNYPLVVFYPTNRAFLEIPERIRGFSAVVHPFDAMGGALSSYLDFRSFISSFRQAEHLRSENMPLLSEGVHVPFIQDGYAEWLSKQVKAVNEAIRGILPEFGRFHVSYTPLRICIEKNGKEYEFLQLSDGEKCLLALIGDLAQRLAIANPVLDDPLQGNAVVLLDELELHLHPAWQGVLVERLLKTFPGCQFILTTHSPLVLGGVEADSIFIMDESNVPFHPTRAYGLDSSEILTEVMGSASRNIEVTRTLERIDSFINDELFDKAREAIRELAKKTGGIPALHAANSDLIMSGQESVELGECHAGNS